MKSNVPKKTLPPPPKAMSSPHSVSAKPRGTGAASARGAWWLLFFSTLHLVALLVLWMMENFVGERNRWTALLLYLPQQGLLLAPLLLLLWTARRQFQKRRASTRGVEKTRVATGFTWISNVSGLALVWFGFLGFNVPLQRRAASPHRLRLRVMTFNIQLGSAGISRIAHLIQNEKPDIVCLQETRSLGAVSDSVPPLQKLLPHWNFARHGEVMTLSRFPIIATRVHPIKNMERVILETQIGARGKSIAVFNTHFITDRPRLRNTGNRLDSLGGSAKLRLYQMRQLQSIVPQNGPRTLVMGDFNNPPRGLLYRSLSSRWTDAFRDSGLGFGFTFRSDLPLLRIDYIWASRDLQVRAAHISRQRASDHRAVIAHVAVP